MAYKYQPIKDEIFASDGEGDEVEDLEEGEAEGETILGSLEDANVEGVAELPPNAKVKQVIEQDGVLILETVEADPNDPDALPAGATLLADGAGGTIIADAEGGAIIDASGAAIIDTNGATIIDTDAIISNGNGHDSTLDTTNGDSSMDDSAILAELEEANLDVKPSPSKKNKDILDQGEKVQCQLCNQSFPAGNLRWHILKEHCHNKVTECSLCEQKFVTKNALKNHIRQVHLSETSTCHICHKEYKDLYHHVKYFHEKIRNYECSYCEKKFQAKKLLYNHVQSIHLGEKTNCPDCGKDISVDNFSRHVRETHERIKKPCPHCDKEFAMSNLSRHIRQVHNNESTECPDCGKALTISNLNKHIKSVHKKLKKTCDICNEEVPYSSISVHKRKVHGIGKPMDEVTPRGPNLKLRKRYQQMQNQEEEFDKLRETPKRKRMKRSYKDEDTTDEENEEEMEDLDLSDEEGATKTIQVGDKNFTFSFA